MKKRLFTFVALLGLFSFAGCGGADKFELSDGTIQREDFGEEKESGSSAPISDLLDSSSFMNDLRKSNRFKLIDCVFDTQYSGGYADILVDQKTRVQYLYYENGLTLLVDREGNPLLYEGELNYYGE